MCNPECEQFDACNEDCGEDAEGVPYGPCHPECEDDEECPCKFDIESEGGGEPNPFVCVDTYITLCAPDEECPVDCDDDGCDNTNLTVYWSANPASVVEWPGGMEGLCVTVIITEPGPVTFTATRGCCQSRPLEVTGVRIRLDSVNFGGNNHNVVRDTTGNRYPTPHWKAGSQDICEVDPFCTGAFGGGWDAACEELANQLGIDWHPVAYRRGQYVRISAVRFSIEPKNLTIVSAETSASATVGSASGIPLQDAGNGFVISGSFQLSDALPFEIQYYHPFWIEWFPEVTVTDGEDQFTLYSCGPCNESFNTLYVTLVDPPPDLALSHTVVDIACRRAKGLDENNPNHPQHIIDAIWLEFKEPVQPSFGVRRVEDNAPLHYYDSWMTPNITLGALLQHGDGQCYAWAELFIACLRVHGVNGDPFTFAMEDTGVTPPTGESRFLVNDWDFHGPPSGGFPYENFPYVNRAAYLVPHDSSSYQWTHFEITAQIGVPGQNTHNPVSLFNHHQVVLIDGQYYDPSYGTGPFGSFEQLYLESVAGDGFVFFDGFQWEFRFKQLNPPP